MYGKFVTPLGITIFLRDLQLKKHPPPISCTESGILNASKSKQFTKQPEPIEVTVFGKTTDFKYRHSLKQYEGRLVICELIITVSRLVHSAKQPTFILREES